MKSKFSIAQTIVLPGILFLICAGTGGILVLAGINSLKGIKDIVLLIGAGVAFLTFGALTIRYYLRIFNTIEINLDGLTIKGALKDKRITWNDIKHIRLTGKKPEKFLFTGTPMEAMWIGMKDGSKEVFFTRYYSNMDRIRTALHFIKLKLAAREAITAECLLPVQRAKLVVSDLSQFQQFRGSILTFYSLAVFAFVFLAMYILVFLNRSTSLWAMAIPWLALLIHGPGLLGYQLHYFSLDQEYLVVKNQIWLWRNDVYLLKDIREIVFEEPNKLATSLRVITNNYESTLYPAGGLRDKHWRELREVFRSHGIRVRNEAFIDL